MKIMLITSLASSFLQFRKELIRHNVDSGRVVQVVAPDFSSGEISIMESLGCECFPYRCSRGSINPLGDLVALYDLFRTIRINKPDVVLSYFAKPVVYGSIAAKLAGTPRVVAMLEGLGYAFTPQPGSKSLGRGVVRSLQCALYSLAFRFIDRLIVLNRDDLLDLKRLTSIPAHCELEVFGPIGLDLERLRFAPIDKSAPTRFIFIGRLLHDKGVLEFLEAASIVKRRFPSATFVILGDVDVSNPASIGRDVVEAFVQEGVVEHKGFVSNVAEELALSHVFVLPSYREGYPRSTQEAMAVGRAVITTDTAGCRETVVNGRNGFLIPLFDVGELARKMEFFILNPRAVQTMGMESYNMAIADFDAHKISRRLTMSMLGDLI